MTLDVACSIRVPGSNLTLRDPDGNDSTFRMRVSASDRAHVRAYLVDGCLITDGQRCDYLVIPNARSAVFIELKGGDVEKGISQLEQSVKILATELNGRLKFAVLVPSRCPLPAYELQKAMDRFRRQYAVKLRVRNREYSCSSDEFS